METMTMSCQDSSGSAWCHCSTDLGSGGGDDDGAQDFLGLFGDRHSSSDDLFELVWRGAAGGGGGGAKQPSCIPLSSPSRRPVAAAAAVVPVPERMPPPPAAAPPSEAEMASWLVPIVCSEEFAGGGDTDVAAGRRRAWVVDDDQMVPSPSVKESSDHKLQQEKRKTSSTGGRRSHYHAEAHSLTEKRRRCKIKEKLKTLQQLVPGCENNSNQASTLDQTIRYMKSLQEHIQAMSSFRCRMKPTSVAVYPVVQQAPCLAWWWQMGHICAERRLPFCGHVSMGSPSPYPGCSDDA